MSHAIRRRETSSGVGTPTVVAEPDTVVAPKTSRGSLVVTLGLIVAVAAALAIGAYFRLWNLDRIGLNSDESVYTGQAATLIGDPTLSRYFSPFRAHPLLLQTALAVTFLVTGVSDVVARAFVAVAFGLTGILATIALARRMYGWPVAILAGAVIAMLPYHVLLSRQVMLDVPVALFLTLGVWALYRFAVEERPRWFLLSAPLAGLAVLTKETAILIVGVAALFILWTRLYRALSVYRIAAWLGLFLLTIAPFFVTRTLLGGRTTGGYLLYQAFRQPNHEWWYFPVVLWEFTSPVVIAAALLGIGIMVWRRSVADKALLSWMLVFGAFFQAWPTKLFPYLIAITPALVIAAAIGVFGLAAALGRRLGTIAFRSTATATAAAVLIPLIPGNQEAMRLGIENVKGPFSADVEVQDFAGAKQMALWARDNTPEGSVFLTIGPSVGNILSFYGHRDWYALSVSPKPHKRNPAYRPIPNPDAAIRTFQVHYAIWDAYSADRSAFYNDRLMRYVRKFSGTVVYSTWLTEDGRVRTGRQPPEGVDARVIVFDLVGGDPLRGVDLQGTP